MMDLSIVILVFLSTVANVTAAECQPEIVGSVLGTFAATLVLVAIAYFIIRKWKRKKDGVLENTRLNISSDDHKYAYDNPYYYNDDETGGPRVNLDTAEKGESVQERGQSNGTPEQKKENGNQKIKKSKTAKTNLLTALTNSKPRPRALDDSCLKLEPEKIIVPLRGIDFTGLGFNICGNMRDGIFVRDVLHRGPAMESGKIKAGDRILSVNVSFANVVYEDALTILSYASPYDVHLEVQKMSDSSGRHHHIPGHQKKASTGSTASGSGLGSGPSSGVHSSTGVVHPSANMHERLYHPLYRSQSIGDLSQIGKDSAGAKRSLSVGAPSKLKKSPSSSVSSGDVSPSPTPKVTPPLVTKVPVEAEVDDVPKSSRFKVEKVSELPVKSAPQDVAIADKITVLVLPDRVAEDVDGRTRKESSSSNEEGKQLDLSVSSGAADESLELREPAISFRPEEVLGSLDDEHKQETAAPPIVKPPRKGSTPGKRKAPPPPARSLSNDENGEDTLENLTLVTTEPFAVSTSTLQVSPDIHEVPKWVREGEGEDGQAQDTIDTSVDSVAIQTAFSDTDSSSEDEPDSRSGPGMAGTFPLRNKRASASRWQESSANNNSSKTTSTKAPQVPRRATSLDNLCVLDSSSRGTRDFVGNAGVKKAPQPPPLERAVSMDFRHVGTLPVGQLSLQRERIDQDRGRLGSAGASTSEELVPLKKPRFGACENLHLEGDSDDEDRVSGGGSSGSWASEGREEETGEREVSPTVLDGSLREGGEGEVKRKFRVTMYVDGLDGSKCRNHRSESDSDSGSAGEFDDSLERKQDALAEPDVVLVSLTPIPPNGEGLSGGDFLDEEAPKTVQPDRLSEDESVSSSDAISSLSDDSLQTEEKKTRVKTKRRRPKDPPLKSPTIKESQNGSPFNDSSEEDNEHDGEAEFERVVRQTQQSVLPDVIGSENGRDHHQLPLEAAAYPLTTVHQDGEIGTSLVTIDIPVIPAAFNMKDRRSPIMNLNSASSSGPSSGSSSGWDRDKSSELFNNVSVSNRTLNPVLLDGSYAASLPAAGKNGEDLLPTSTKRDHEEIHHDFSSSDEDSCNGHGRDSITPRGDTIHTVNLVDTTTIAGKTVGPEYKYAVSDGNVMVIIPHSQFNPEQGNEPESPPPRLEAPE